MTPQEHAKQARILYESLSRREHLVNRERFENIVSDHIQRALDEQAALRSPAPAATGDWAVNAMKRIDSIPKPSRESWSVLSWEEYYKECARIIQACYPQPAATVTGWRPEWGVVDESDTLQDGDQYKDAEGEWVDTDAVGEKACVYEYLTFRRRLTPPALVVTDDEIDKRADELIRDLEKLKDRNSKWVAINRALKSVSLAATPPALTDATILPIEIGAVVEAAMKWRANVEKHSNPNWISVADLMEAVDKYRSAVAALSGEGV